MDFIENLELYNVPLADLLKLKGNVDRLIEQAKIAEIDKMREALPQTAAQLGMHVSELVEKLTSAEPFQYDTPTAKSKVAGTPKYFHPNDWRTWTGKGKRPKWVVEHLEAGGTLDGLTGPQSEAPDALPNPEVKEMPF